MYNGLKLECAPIEDSDKFAHPHNLIKVFAVHPMSWVVSGLMFLLEENYMEYCKFGNFRESLIFAKLRICEVS